MNDIKATSITFKGTYRLCIVHEPPLDKDL